MWLFFLCMLIAFGIDRHLKTRTSPVASPTTMPAFVSLTNDDDSYTYDLCYKSAWIAIRHEPVSSEYVGQWLITHHSLVKVLLFQSMQGWTILSAEELPDLSEAGEQLPLFTMLQALSEEFGEVQYFASHRTVEYYAWVKYTDGILQRAYSYLWGTVMNEGAETSIEKLHLPHFMLEGELLPDEELVLTIAKDWSVLPEELILEATIQVS
ncbi:hypothetical protein [Paenibacillus wenxiniae]|uniref:Uncharacterized protein n=1 Tax=Paenibacillus wenxiniae TaxID=1636843 RepID=A0ABW4RCZ1_9BACL